MGSWCQQYYQARYKTRPPRAWNQICQASLRFELTTHLCDEAVGEGGARAWSASARTGGNVLEEVGVDALRLHEGRGGMREEHLDLLDGYVRLVADCGRAPVHHERVLVHLPRVERVLAHAVRVARAVGAAWLRSASECPFHHSGWGALFARRT